MLAARPPFQLYSIESDGFFFHHPDDEVCLQRHCTEKQTNKQKPLFVPVHGWFPATECVRACVRQGRGAGGECYILSRDRPACPLLSPGLFVVVAAAAVGALHQPEPEPERRHRLGNLI